MEAVHSRSSRTNFRRWIERSADGKTLASGRLEPIKNEWTITMIDMATRAVRTLKGSQGIFAPRWSPDGRYIVAISYGNGKLQLYDFRSDKWTTPDLPISSFGYLAWSKDSAYLYFDTDYRTIPATARERPEVGEDD